MGTLRVILLMYRAMSITDGVVPRLVRYPTGSSQQD